MVKNRNADTCKNCGELIYYGGNNPCAECTDSNNFEIERAEACMLIEQKWESLLLKHGIGTVSEEEQLHTVLDIYHDTDFHKVIWEASTELLPKLEVQVVIDGKNNCFVSTGTSGYVDFFQPPVGMTLPIRCWIHTHPFGEAYFSGTDIRTVSIWEVNMECAYVLGGEGHYGFWSQTNPKQLEIYLNDIQIKTQTWGDEEE